MIRALAIAFITLHSATAAYSQGCKAFTVGYPTTSSALQALQKKPGVQISIQSGWTIIDDRLAQTLWSFTPAGHQAHPAVVRRTIVEKDSAFHVCMAVLCEAPKPACDKLAAEFNELTNRMRREIESKRQPKT